MEMQLKYPCGLEFKLKGLFIERDFKNLKEDWLEECPMHGKTCPILEEKK